MKELLDGFSVERLEHVAALAERCGQDQIVGFAAKEVSALARIALAVKQAQPYGYVHQAVFETNGTCGLSNDHESYADSSTHIPLYRTPQPAQEDKLKPCER